MPEPTTYPQVGFVPPAGATTIVLVRHGQSEAAVEGQPFALVDGRGDPALSELGRRQADALGRRLGAERIDAIYVSALQRTAQTAQPLAERLGLGVEVDPRLSEVFLGEWEGGLFRKMVAERDPVALRLMHEQRWEVVPGAETSADFTARVRAAVEAAAAAHPVQRIAVFCHGGVIGALLAEATGARPFSFLGADNASVSELVIAPERWIVRSYNDTSHLVRQ